MWAKETQTSHENSLCMENIEFNVSLIEIFYNIINVQQTGIMSLATMTLKSNHSVNYLWNTKKSNKKYNIYQNFFLYSYLSLSLKLMALALDERVKNIISFPRTSGEEI